MNTYIPKLLAAGQFTSTIKFPNIKQSPLRIVTEYELEFYFEDGGISFLNGKKYPMKKGNILVARPGDKRSSTLPFRCYYIHLTNVSPELKALIEPLPSFMHTKDYDLFEGIFSRIADDFISVESTENIAAIGELFILIKHLHHLKLQSYQSDCPKNEDSILELALKHIDFCYTQELTVEFLAGKCNVSPSYLYRLFAEKLGVSPHTAILNRRLTAARSMLIHTNLSLNDIAANCGFNSQAYFSDCFKKHNNGLTPSAFRQQAEYTP